MRNGAADVFLGIGGNLACDRLGPPRAVMDAAVAALGAAGIAVRRRSRWYRSAPVPASSQPPFVNGVLQVETALTPAALMAALHGLEARFGRVRSAPNAARILDLDLLAYGSVLAAEPGGLQLPHPRLHLRTFVLLPLAEVAPGWRHPRLGLTAGELLAALPPEVAAGQEAEPLPPDTPPDTPAGGDRPTDRWPTDR